MASQDISLSSLLQSDKQAQQLIQITARLISKMIANQKKKTAVKTLEIRKEE